MEVVRPSANISSEGGKVMSLELNLSSDLEQRLLLQAGRLNLPAEQYTLQLLEQHLPRDSVQSDVVALLQGWIDEGDAGEQKKTAEFLFKALDEDRLSNRKLFPPDMQGVSW